MRLSVLVSGPDAAALAEALAARTDRLDCVVAPTDATARAYLSGTVFDSVLVTGESREVETLAEALGRTVERVTRDTDAEGLLRRLGIPTGEGRGPSDPDVEAAAEQIRALRSALAEVAHDLNNPVAVIQGNAQLALELGQDLDPVIAESLRDIDVASRVLAERIRQIGALRRAADAALATLGAS